MNAQTTDRYGDIVVTDGIQIDEFEKNPVGLLFHNARTWPVATWENLEKVLKGRPRRLEGDFVLLPPGGPVKEIDETEWMLANGGIRACSIGFTPDWEEAEMILDEDEKWTGGIRWVRTTLLECSICAVPASPQALVKAAGRDINLAKELLEDVLDNWVRTPEGLLLSRAKFEKEYKITVEKLVPPARPKDPNQLEMPVEPAEETIETFLAKAIKGDTVHVIRDLRETASVDGWSQEAVADSERAVIIRDGKDVATFKVEDAADATAKILARMKDLYPEPPAPMPPAAPEEPRSITVKLDLDAMDFDKKVEGVSSWLVDVQERFKKFFGAKETEPEERIEPTIDSAPSPEAIAAARSKATALRDRVAAKGLI